MANGQEVSEFRSENEDMSSQITEEEQENEEAVVEEIDEQEADVSDRGQAEENEESNDDPEPEEDAEEASAEDGGEDEDEEDEDDEDEEEEEDPEDPADALRESCTKAPTCKPLLKSFETCEERVNSKSHTEETCLEEYISFIKCRDKCVSRDLFSKLK